MFSLFRWSLVLIWTSDEIRKTYSLLDITLIDYSKNFCLLQIDPNFLSWRLSHFQPDQLSCMRLYLPISVAVECNSELDATPLQHSPYITNDVDAATHF